MLSAAPASGTQLRTPDAKEIGTIEVLLSDGRVADRAVKAKEAEIYKLTRRLGSRNARIVAHKELRRLQDDRDMKYRRAVDKALVSYGIVDGGSDGRPIMPEFRMVDSHGGVSPRRWLVAFGPPRERLTSSPDGEEIMWPDEDSEKRAKRLREIEKKYNAVTTNDGVTLLWNDVATPAALAALLIHERVHAEMYADKEWMKRTFGERELHAMTSERLALASLGIPRAELELRTANLDERISVLSDELKKKRIFLPAFAFIERFSGRMSEGHSTAMTTIPELQVERGQLDEIRVRSGKLADDIRRQDAERAREAVEQSVPSESRPGFPTVFVPALPPPAVVATLPRPVERAFSPEISLNSLASNGCADPYALEQEELDWSWSRLLGTRYRPEKADAMGLSGCQRVLFLRLMSMAAAGTPSRLTREDFAAVALEARMPPPQFEEIPEPRRGTQPPDRPRCRFMGDWCN